MLEIKIPAVGESVTEGTLARWLKADGATVKVDEPLFELETEKASQEIPSPGAGVLRIQTPAGTVVTIGAVVGTIDSAGKPAASPPAAPPPPTSSEPALSPAARRVVAEERLDPKQLTGTGRGGVITKEDAVAASKPASPPPPPPAAPTPPVPPPTAAGRETRQKMTRLRQTVAQRLVEAQHTTASLTTFNEADLSAIMDMRAKYKDKFKDKHGVGLGFMSFFVKAVVSALQTYPIVNSRIDGTDIITANYYDIGVAVSTEKGLMVPVLRDADKLSCAGIEKAIAALATKARDGKISLDDLRGGTFTITNGGVFGSMLSTPILNAPQSAILGMHAINKRPVAINDQVVIRPMMYLALSYDHRLIDGRDAVLFLVRIKECLESPERLLLEV